MTMNAVSDIRTVDAMDEFYDDVRRVHGRPLWQTQGTSKKAPTVPHLWRYSDFRPLLFRAAEIVPIELAERRVLVMANPRIQNDWQASNTLLANLQIIKAGEVARSHRHSASALRLMVEGAGAYTAVETETLTGDAIAKAGIEIGEPVRPDSEVVVVRFPPVKTGQSLRIRIEETYTDPARYAQMSGQLVWRRSFGRPRNDLVLPDGWYVTTSSMPATVSQMPDGRIRLAFVNARPDSLDVFVKARRR